MNARRASRASLADDSLPSLPDVISAARPRTLPAAVVPVMVGIALARSLGAVSPWRSACAAIVALAIQVGTNFANDYGDGVRGADKGRVGPMRLVASGKASPKVVRAMALFSFSVAAVIGLVVALSTSLWLLVLGAACIAAGWLYTAGPAPYGYRGLGELFVFIFFGEVAVLGTTYVASRHFSWWSVLDAVPVGLLAVSLLVVNNLRDIPSDATAGKRTLAVVLGDRRTRTLYRLLVGSSFGFVVIAGLHRHFALLALLAVVAAIGPLRIVASGATGRRLIDVLAHTGRLQLIFGVLFAIGLAI